MEEELARAEIIKAIEACKVMVMEAQQAHGHSLTLQRAFEALDDAWFALNIGRSDNSNPVFGGGG